MDEETVKKIKRNNQHALMGIEGVNAVSVGLVGGEIGIIVEVDYEEAADRVPNSVEGVPIEVRLDPTDHAEHLTDAAAPEQDGQRQRHRPVQPGVSAHRIDSSSCTANFIWYDPEDDEHYIGGNNHCYASTNQRDWDIDIVQPSPWDGGGSDDAIGTLAGYVPVQDGATVDFAWSTLEVDWIPDVFGHGTITDPPVEPSLGDTVVKSSRTTGFGRGQVEQIDRTAAINYGDDVGVIEIDQVFRSSLNTEGGDSGSPILKETADGYAPIGVHFASGGTHCKVTRIMEITGFEVQRTGGSFSKTPDDPACVQDIV